jgi:hypothetical protein
MDLWVQADAAEAARQATAAEIRRNLRAECPLYWPRPEALDGRWHMPAMQRAD